MNCWAGLITVGPQKIYEAALGQALIAAYILMLYLIGPTIGILRAEQDVSVMSVLMQIILRQSTDAY